MYELYCARFTEDFLLSTSWSLVEQEIEKFKRATNVKQGRRCKDDERRKSEEEEEGTAQRGGAMGVDHV